MKQLRRFAFGFAILAICAWAADKWEVKHVKYYSTSGGEAITGHIAVADDKLVFVDDTNPQMTFTVTRGVVKTTHIENGRVVFEMSEPVTIQEKPQSNVTFVLPDTRTREEVMTWVKVKK